METKVSMSISANSGGGSGKQVSDNKVLISVNNTDVLQNHEGGPKTPSLDRLEILDEGEDSQSTELYKCSSFSRLPKRYADSDMDVNTNCSMTHLETSSISPRVSTTNLTNLTRDDYMSSRDRLTLGTQLGLVRSISSRTVDELPPLDIPLIQTRGMGPDSHRYLSPTYDGTGRVPLVSRSTSCPSMAYARRSPSQSPRAGQSPRVPHKDGIPGVGEHLPRPGKPSEDLAEAAEGEAPAEDTKANPAVTADQVDQPTSNHSPAPEANGSNNTSQGAVLNIRDIPSSVAEKVISEQSAYKPERTENVRRKCLRWLNSLDLEDND